MRATAKPVPEPWSCSYLPCPGFASFSGCLCFFFLSANKLLKRSPRRRKLQFRLFSVLISLTTGTSSHCAISTRSGRGTKERFHHEALPERSARDTRGRREASGKRWTVSGKQSGEDSAAGSDSRETLVTDSCCEVRAFERSSLPPAVKTKNNRVKNASTRSGVFVVV